MEPNPRILTAALCASSNAVVITDRSGVIEWVNPAFTLLTGYTQEEVIGLNPRVLKSGLQDDGFYRSMWETIRRGQVWRGEIINRRKDGTIYTERMTISPVRESGEIIHFIAIKEDISEHRRTEEALWSSRNRLQTLYDGITDAVFIHGVTPEGLTRFLEVNDVACERLGYSRHELLAMTPIDLDDPASGVDLGHISRRLIAGESVIFEQVHIAKDGRRIPVEISARLCYLEEGPAVMSLVRDISERKHAEQLFFESQQIFRTLVESSPDVIARHDANCKRTYVNPKYLEASRIAGQELVGTSPLELSPLDASGARALNSLLRRVIRRGVPSNLDLKLDQAKGVRWYNVIAYPEFDRDGNVAGVMTISRDITERKQSEAAVQELNSELEIRVLERTAELQRAKEDADLANLAKSEFLSRMSHELRTPLNAVLGFAQLLDMTLEEAKAKEALGAIIRGGNHLLNLINEVLDLSRIERGGLALTLEPVSVVEVLNEAFDLLHPIASKAGIAVGRVDEATCALSVMADKQRLLQVLINILNNAVKYNRESGEIYVRCEERQPGICRIEIADTGPGIEEKDRALLFEPFQRFGDQQIEGTGLGLALSKRYMGLMNGNLGLAASSPSGSVFYLELAVAGMPPEKVEEEFVPAPHQRPNDRRGCTILYVEDNPTNMLLVELALRRRPSCRLIPAALGRLGLELACRHLPDLVLLDLHLPDVGGEEVLEKLKSNPATAGIPVVIVSADATTKRIKSLRAQGAVGYLTKPLDLVRFFETLDEHMPRQAVDPA